MTRPRVNRDALPHDGRALEPVERLDGDVVPQRLEPGREQLGLVAVARGAPRAVTLPGDFHDRPLRDISDRVRPESCPDSKARLATWLSCFSRALYGGI